MRFRKKPVVIDAFRWTADCDQMEDPMWIIEALGKPWGEGAAQIGEVDGKPVLGICTLEGIMEAQVGDWIIQGVKGEIYPCKPDIFEATYEPVE